MRACMHADIVIIVVITLVWWSHHHVHECMLVLELWPLSRRSVHALALGSSPLLPLLPSKRVMVVVITPQRVCWRCHRHRPHG